MKKLIVILIIAMPFMMWQCTEVKEWQDAKDNIAPGPVSNPQVENLNGGAKITYTLPDDDDLLGVKAVYSLNDDVLRSAYASALNDSIVLDGYGNTEEHIVTLFTLDKSGNESVPVSVAINPLKPPVELIRQSLEVQKSFGGIYLKWNNAMKKEIAITLYAADSTGYMQYYDAYYSNAEAGATSFRGFESVSHDFRIEIRDRWNNYASPLDTAIIPMQEQNIFGRDENNQVIWSFYGMADGTAAYRGDQTGFNSGNMGTLTDGTLYGSYCQIVNFSDHYIPISQVPQELFCPYYLTLDMNKTASYSRFKLWQGNRNPIGSAIFPIVFSLWGTNDPKPVDVSAGVVANLVYWTGWPKIGSTDRFVTVGGTDEWMNDWEKLGEYRLVYPSGWSKYVVGIVTAADEEFIREGFEFEIDMDKTDKPFRYLRFKVEDTTNSQGQIMVSEIRFWGNFVE